MISVVADKLARDLCRVLSDLKDLYGQMAAHMRDKLEAIKQADSDRIQSITSREMVLADKVRQRESLRKQITRRIFEELHLEGQKNQDMKMTEVAEYFPEPRRSQLLVAAAGLRDRLFEIDRLRVTSTLITQEMLKHLGAVISVMKSGQQAEMVYSRSGRREPVQTANVFEAVG